MSAMRSLVCSFACFSSLLAQGNSADKGTPRAVSAEDARVAERAQEMRENLEVGSATTSPHVRVAVRLRNGSRLAGLVKDGRMAERMEGRQFVAARADDAGAGVRIWGAAGGRDYVFVSFRDIAEYQVLQRLTQRQLEQLEREVQLAGERQQPAIEPSAVNLPGGDVTTLAGGPDPSATTVPGAAPQSMGQVGAAPGATVTTAGSAPKAGDDALHKEWFALLQEYPPAAGYGAEKRDEIARRLAVVGAKPSAAELRFVEKFDDWQKACAFFGVKPASAKTAEGEEAADVHATRRASSSARGSSRETAEENGTGSATKSGRNESGRRNGKRTGRAGTTEETSETEGEAVPSERRSNRRQDR